MMNDNNKEREGKTPAVWQRRFFTIWMGQAFSLFGSQLVQFALVWWLTQSTGSAKVLAMASLAGILPQIFLSPFAGALVDRWNRRKVMIAADTGIALATISLAVLFALKAVEIEIWHIYALMFIRSLGSAFHWPAMQASTTLLVPEELLSRIAGLNQTLEGAANIAAPPMAALLIGLLPMEGVLSLDVITAGLAILPLLFIAIPQPATGEKASAGSLITAEIMEALRFVFAKPGFVFMFILAMLVNLVIVPAFSLLPLLVKVHFRGGALQLAGLESSMGFGMIAGGLALGVWGGFKSRMLTGISALILAGVSFGLLGVLPSTGLVLAMATIFVTGLMLPVANGSMHALMQAVIPPEMQGRVFTLVISGASAMIPIGLALAGPMAEAVSVNFWFTMGGVLTAALGLAALCLPAVMSLEESFEAQAVECAPQAPPIDRMK